MAPSYWDGKTQQFDVRASRARARTGRTGHEGVVVAEEFPDEGDGDIRRRAAWLLVMLAVVAGLIVVLMVTFLNSSSPSDPKPVGIGGPGTSTDSATSSTPARRSTPRPRPTPKASRRTQGPVTRTCPTKDICILQGDPGNAIQAINDYRKQNNLPPVPGKVSTAAQTCALSNGSNCSGHYAFSQVPDLSGASALGKIKSLGKLLDPQMKSLDVGWALNPNGTQYFFAMVRND